MTGGVDMTETGHVAFVGLGAMGGPMAANLVAAGETVIGFDMEDAALDRLQASGGSKTASAAEAASGARVLMLMVVNDAQARTVLFDDGALAALPGDATVILMATCLPGAAKEIGIAVTQTGRGFLDAPVSGGVVGATAGNLTIMAAGADTTFDAVRTLLEIVGGRVFRVGDRPGQGAVAKAVNQLLCGVHLAAAGEAMTLAEAMGLDLATMLEIVGGSAAASWMLNDRGPRMISDPDTVTSTVDIFTKDLGIVLSVGREAKTALPLSAAAHQMFLAATGRGEGMLDDSQVIGSYRALSSKR
jgi:3-hydroxyisobutyrate dehydrogenase